MANNTTEITGTVAPAPKKGDIEVGTIVSISQGNAIEYMTPDQCVRRQTNEDTPFLQIEVAVAGTIVTRSMIDYTNVGKGGIPANSTLGKILNMYPLIVDGSLNMLAKEIMGNDGSPYVVWDIVV